MFDTDEADGPTKAENPSTIHNSVLELEKEIASLKSLVGHLQRGLSRVCKPELNKISGGASVGRQTEEIASDMTIRIRSLRSHIISIREMVQGLLNRLEV